jgi:hypothetical protein
MVPDARTAFQGLWGAGQPNFDDGKVSVLNECYDGSFSGKLRAAKGKAWVVDKETKSKLKVSFFWFFAGDYWIIDIADDYSYVVVGHPKRKYLVLSRTKMDESVYNGILSLAISAIRYIKTDQTQNRNKYDIETIPRAGKERASFHRQC